MTETPAATQTAYIGAVKISTIGKSGHEKTTAIGIQKRITSPTTA